MKNNYGKIFPYNNLTAKISTDTFIAPGVIIIGDVEIKSGSSIWYNCVIRGDVNFIRIGNNTNIQDLSMLHVTNKKYPLIIDDNTTIGHAVKLHGCTIEELTLIGIGAVVLDGAVVKKNSIVAAGSVVKPGFIVPENVLVAGVPARIIRNLSELEIEDLALSANRYKQYSHETIASLNKLENEKTNIYKF